MEREFVSARRRALNGFIQEIGKQPILFNSFEFLLFIKYSHDNLTKQYNALLKLKPGDILQRNQAIVNIDVTKIDGNHLLRCS